MWVQEVERRVVPFDQGGCEQVYRRAQVSAKMEKNQGVFVRHSGVCCACWLGSVGRFVQSSEKKCKLAYYQFHSRITQRKELTQNCDILEETK